MVKFIFTLPTKRIITRLCTHYKINKWINIIIRQFIRKKKQFYRWANTRTFPRKMFLKNANWKIKGKKNEKKKREHKSISPILIRVSLYRRTQQVKILIPVYLDMPPVTAGGKMKQRSMKWKFSLLILESILCKVMESNRMSARVYGECVSLCVCVYVCVQARTLLFAIYLLYIGKGGNKE